MTKAWRYSYIRSTPFKNKVGLSYSFVCGRSDSSLNSCWSESEPHYSCIKGQAVMPFGESSIKFYDSYDDRPHKNMPFSRIYSLTEK